MPVIFSDTISGSGAVDWADIEVDYILVDVLERGGANSPDLNDPDHILRFGWVALRRIEDPFGEPRTYWRAPIWIDFEHFYWTPIPAWNASADLAIWSQGIRWSLSLGAEAFIEVGAY